MQPLERGQPASEVIVVKATALPPVELLRARFVYEPDTGLLRYAARPFRSRVKVGDAAGKPKGNGYLQVMVDNRVLLVHRVVWKLYTGLEPPAVIDHINRQVWDNRWDNLRGATYSQNQGNRRGAGQYLPGAFPRYNRWQAAASSNYIGMYATEKEAHQAYVQWHLQKFGEFSIYAD